MRLYFLGAENPGHRKRLIEWGVKSLAINFKHLYPRLPKKSSWLVEERFPGDVRVIVHCEIPDAQPELVDVYWDWVEVNAQRLDFAVEPTWEAQTDEDELVRWRQESAAIPIWQPEQGHRALQKLADGFSGLAVFQSAWESDRPVSARLNRVVMNDSMFLHGIGVSRWKILSEVAFGSVSTGAWTSAQRYGETQVWDGAELHRFSASDRDARQRYRAQIVRSGLDADAIEAGDKDEVSKLAVWSWLQVEDALSKRRDVQTEVEIGHVVPETTENLHPSSNGQVVTIEPGTKSPEPSTNVVRTRETKALPVALYGRNDATDETFEVSSETKRVCDHCQLDRVCPEYSAGASCAYSIPVKIRTKDQIVSMLNGVIEMQTQRVMFARFREDLEGSIDRVVSDELDRLMDLTEKYKDIVDDAATFKMQIEARGQAGVLSRLFGSKVGEAARELPGGGLDEIETEQFLRRVVEPLDQVIDVPGTTNTN